MSLDSEVITRLDLFVTAVTPTLTILGSFEIDTKSLPFFPYIC